MVDLAVEGMGVELADIRMGTMTIKAVSLVDIPRLEPILQPTPTGMIILGLELKSKFVWCLIVTRLRLMFLAFLFPPSHSY